MKNDVPVAVQACHDLLKWMVPVLDQFPRNRRFSLGERLEDGLLTVLELLIEAAYSSHKGEALKRANLRLQRVRHLWRLCYELKVINGRRYENGSRLIDDVGRQVGGVAKEF